MDECCREALADFLAVTVCKSSVFSGISLGDRSIICHNLAQTVNVIQTAKRNGKHFGREKQKREKKAYQ